MTAKKANMMEISTPANTDSCWPVDQRFWDSSSYLYTYPYYSDQTTILNLQQEVAELKKKLQLLECETGMEVVEVSPYKVVKSKKK